MLDKTIIRDKATTHMAWSVLLEKINLGVAYIPLYIATPIQIILIIIGSSTKNNDLILTGFISGVSIVLLSAIISLSLGAISNNLKKKADILYDSITTKTSNQ